MKIKKLYDGTEINEKEFKKWIEALRSGEFKQTKGRLQGEDGYCCLGVGCEVLIPRERQMLNIDEPTLFGENADDQAEAPSWLHLIDESFDKTTGELLVDLNDEEDFTFDEIADVLEAVYVHGALE